MVKFFVRTTGDRVLDKSYNQINYELLIDKDHQPLKSFITQLDYISDYDAILLEDDCILCDQFEVEINKVIAQYPNKIINFFTFPNKYFKTTEDFRFCFNQCTYYPKGIAAKLASIMKQYPNFKLGYDVLETRAMKKLDITHVRYRPCLVQHLDNDTLISKFTLHKRRTPYFIDYLNELKINYDDAEAAENTNKLIELLNKKFNNDLKA